MDLKQLQTFLVLSEIKNFTKTAQYLHYAQSSVTTQIQQLEKELNVKLFERINKSVSLTAAGYELIPYANKIINLSNEIQIRFSSNYQGRIILGASESICIYKLPEIIKTFQLAYPNIELYLEVLDSADVTPLLEDNIIDIAFILDAPIYNSNIKTCLKQEENICVCTLPDHPLVQRQVVTINDFAQQRFIFTGKDCCYRKKFENELLEANIKPNIALETGSLQIIKQTVLSGLGICILPQLAVQKELDEGKLVKLNYQTNYGISSQLIYHKDKWISQDLNNLIQMIKKFGYKE